MTGVEEIIPDQESKWPRRTILKAIGGSAAGGALAPLTIGSAAATKDSQSKAQFGLGANEPFGNGRIATFALPDVRGRLGMLGVLITARALKGLPDELLKVHMNLPQVAGSNFTFMGLDWNPGGHAPAPIYGLPHFDIHFYLMEEEAVEAIKPGTAEYMIPDEQRPSGYVTGDELGAPREIVPEMGEHLVNPMAPEFQGEKFTHTLIWGAYNPANGDVGELTFVEPMITTEYLESKPDDVHAPISTPEVFAKAGYYPTEYVIRYLPVFDVYLVTLEAFEWFPGAV
ncbi:hypothetical protein [Haladaptatus sp. NG-SE-30]